MQRFREQKIINTQKDYLEKFKNTEEARRKREQEVLELEAFEAEIIKRIDQT